jgi:hypothetical protein
VTRAPRAQRIAGHLIARACRRLPGDIRDERYREWAAELPAIRHDPDIHFALLRSVRTLSFAVGIYASTRHRHRAAGISPEDTRQPAIFPRPDGVFPAIAGVIVWLILVALVNAYAPHGFWVPLVVAVSVADGVFIVAQEIRFVRWVRRRSGRTPHA